MKMTLKVQLVVALFLVGLIPFLVMGISSYVKSAAALEHEAEAKLEMARQLKKAHLETYLTQVDGVISILGHQEETVSLFKELVRLHHEHNVQPTENYHKVTEDPEYKKVISHFEEGFRRVTNTYNLNDLYMLCHFEEGFRRVG